MSTKGHFKEKTRYLILFLVISIVCPTMAKSTEHAPKTEDLLSPFSPEHVKNAIERLGAKKVLQVMFDEKHLKETIKAFHSSDRGWIDLYPLLRSESDGFWSEVLDTSLSKLIEKDATRALAILTESEKKSRLHSISEEICGAVDPNLEEESEKEQPTAKSRFLMAKYRAIESVKQSEYSQIAKRCLDSICLTMKKNSLSCPK